MVGVIVAGNSCRPGVAWCMVACCSVACCRQLLLMNRPALHFSATFAEKIVRADTSVSLLEHTVRIACMLALLGTHSVYSMHVSLARHTQCV